MSAADTITILRSRGRRLAKLIRSDGGIEGYDSARTFVFFERRVDDLSDLGRLLAALLRRPDRCIVRGGPIDPAHSSGVRRLLYADPRTGDAATLRDVPHQWCALDLDGIEPLGNVTASDLTGCAHVATRRLPAAFRIARCIVQASASHGIAPGIRLRLWFWLSRPTSGTELKQWLRGTPVDSCLFRPVQICYTAAPIFASGRDHLPRRMIELAGAEMVQAPSPETLRPPPPRPAAPLPHPTETRANAYAWAALRNATVRVATAGIGQRHYRIIAEARGLARFTAAGLLTESEVRSALAGAARNAGKPEDEAASAIAWGIAHPISAPLPEVVR